MKMFEGRDFATRMVATDSLKPRARNPRKHSQKQLRKLVASLETFGWTNPILVDEADVILGGHGRWEAAKLIGLAEVPAITIGSLSEAEKRAYVIADNALAEKSGWSKALLATELQGLIELGFDVELTGFDTIEIDHVLTAFDGEGPTTEAPEFVAMPGTGPAVSRLGDLWVIGNHRIYCGSALDQASYEALMAGAVADMAFVDPPYNVPVEGHVSGLGRTQHREFAMAVGEMTPDQFTAFLRQSFRLTRAVSAAGAIHFVCIDWRHVREVLDAADGVYAEYKNMCVWAKTNAGMGSFYRSQHELMLAFKATAGKHINNFGLGEGGRHRSNLWTYAGANTFRPGRMKDLVAHPTCKPIRLVADAILDCSKRGSIVLDAFMGSGTTAVAAARTGRRGYGIELDPLYVDLIVNRLAEEAGQPIIDQEGHTFAEVAAARGVSITPVG